MARNLRSAVLLHVALLSTATAAVAVGCATSAEIDVEGLGSEGAADSGKKDARAVDGATDDDDDDDDDGKKDAEPSDPKTDDDDAGTGGADAGDAGTDAGVPKDGGADAGDAGTDAGVPKDGGADAGDASGGGDAGDAGNGTAVKPIQGEVIISEVMYRPSGTEPEAEWIELYNAAATPRLLSGLVLKDGASRAPHDRFGARDRARRVRRACEQASGRGRREGAGRRDRVQLQRCTRQHPVRERNPARERRQRQRIVLLDGATEIARAKYGSTAKLGPEAVGRYSAAKGQSDPAQGAHLRGLRRYDQLVLLGQRVGGWQRQGHARRGERLSLKRLVLVTVGGYSSDSKNSSARRGPDGLAFPSLPRCARGARGCWAVRVLAERQSNWIRGRRRRRSLRGSKPASAAASDTRPTRAPTDSGDASFETCAATAVEATRERLPVDIIWIVDNSSSMQPAIAEVQAGLNKFAELVDLKGIDYQVVMLSKQGTTPSWQPLSDLHPASARRRQLRRTALGSSTRLWT